MPTSPKQSSSELTVNASPTKSFFITVLIKDIDFIDALIELIDNSVDAVRACHGDAGMKKGHVKVSYTSTEVVVEDDGVGISLEQARESAFRFGRPPKARAVPGSVGAFGVGMKRALFKIGQRFEVTSSTKDEYFRIPVDVSKWEKQDEGTPSDWTFTIVEEETNLRNVKTGTRIQVDRLHEYSKEELRSATFGSRLRDKLQAAHEHALGQGLKVTINDIALQVVTPTILVGRQIKPIYIEDKVKVDKAEVSVRIYAGIGADVLRDAGWYIFCNGRQIERAEKTRRTGWDTALEAGDKTPRPHWQFRRFRGYVFFESLASNVLPWNTMKTGLNVETPVYRQTSQQMALALRDVISFLNEFDAEEDENGPLHKAVKTAKYVQLKNVPLNAAFKSPDPTSSEGKFVRISFTREIDLVERVRDELGVATNKEAGERIFDLFVRSRKLL